MNDMPYIDTKGRVYTYGEFFPNEFCHNGYKETVALDTEPVTKERALALGYPWKEKEKKDYKNALHINDLPDSIDDVSDQILSQIIACPNDGKEEYQCTTDFKITQNELQFYRQKHLPLPRYCPNCRHYQRLAYRNAINLWHRNCMCEKGNHFHSGMKCPNEFETTYAPDRPETVYCEKCYQQEVV
jgi:hypothetical protein